MHMQLQAYDFQFYSRTIFLKRVLRYVALDYIIQQNYAVYGKKYMKEMLEKK